MRSNETRMAAHWMPFTANRRFLRDPLLMSGADGMFYTTEDGSRLLDGIAGLWCVNAGHGRSEIVQAIQAQAAKLDYVSSFNLGHAPSFTLAERLAARAPGDLNHVFFSNSGSEAIDTALKIALAYHRVRGEGQRQRLVGRERAYHGVGFGGLSVAGLGGNRKQFGMLLPGVSHLHHTQHPAINDTARGQPADGAELANQLEDFVYLHGDGNIAAVVVEPVTGVGGVLAAPQGYLQRLREICDRWGILLIFDEVITGFGRIGANFAAERFGVVPDMIVSAKGLTNGAMPMGATLVRSHIYDAFMAGPEAGPELLHGYTYSAHPLACAAALATLDIHDNENLAGRVLALETPFADAAHALAADPLVTGVRTIGALAAIDLETVDGVLGRRALQVHQHCLTQGVLVRNGGDTVFVSPPLVMEQGDIDRIFQSIAIALKAVA